MPMVPTPQVACPQKPLVAASARPAQVHLRYFCGPNAMKTEAQAKQQKKRGRGAGAEEDGEDEDEVGGHLELACVPSFA